MRKIITLLSCLICLQLSAQITTYNISRSINCTDTIQPFTTNANSYGISIDGEGQFLSDTAFIRVVLVDNNGNEWLIYERNSLFATEENAQFQGAAFETTALYNINPKSIIVTLCDASFYLASITNNRTVTSRNDVLTASDSVFLSKNLQIVDRINAKLTAHKKAWRADTTFLSNLRYRDKKALFGNELPNLEGWDYYAYGYYSPLNDNTPPASDNIVKEFDWRTRHGSQNTGSYYYNSDGSGWIPQWRYGQGAGHPDCWAFSTLYSVESMVNLYFNQQLNDELSVQDILSCSDGRPLGPGSGHGGITDTALIYAAREGIVNESCFGYITWYDTVPCERKCSNPNEIVKIGGSVLNLSGEELVKSQLITKGPLVCSVIKWGHAMSMVGFGVVKAGDPVLYGNFNAGTGHDFVVERDSPDIGKPYYIFKQSYATYGYDDSHFCNIIIDANNGAYLKCRSIDTPITSLLYDDSDIDCADNDGDGYYNWGIGPKPATCPNCPDEEDCDDSSPLIGPYNEKYECMVLCENYAYSSTPEYITGESLWGSETYIDHDVIVENGGVLTIENTVFMGESTKIIVKPGGKLILDYRAVLTGLCGSMWQGIEVWGNSSTHQSSINGVCGQGWLELRNGAVIENAKCAVELWRPDHWTTTGGVIHASDATFRNNAMAVRAVCYQNYHPYTHVPLNYNAYFNNCSFIVDNDYLGTETFQKHVVLAEVDGIAFSGCDFSANRSVSGVDPWCIGISAYDAHFSVTSPCTTNNTPCPDEDLDHSTFTGLCSGITAKSDGSSPRSFTVRNTLFINNDFGIHAENTDFPTILFNDFRIGGSCDFNYGVCLRNVTGFCIEENLFRPYSKSKTTTVGIAVYHSNGVNDIYRNTFQNLSRANLALGQNTTGGTNSTLLGLTYSCNDFSGNQRDIMVLQRDGAGDIQSQQGSSSCPSGNTFSNSTFQVYNDGLHEIDYHYNSSEADETPTPSLLYRVNRQETTNANACATHYGNSPVVKSPSEKSALEAEYLSAYNAYSNLRRLYESHMDNSGAQDPTADNSPTTEMLQISAQMAYYSHKYRLAAGDIIRSNLNDSIANPTELRSWLGNMNDIAADRMAISSYLQEGDSASAFALANTLPALYGLQGGQLSDHADYLRLLQLHQTLNRTHRNVFQLTQEETGLVADIADNGNGVSQSMARAMMEQVSNRETSSCLDPELPDSERGEKGWNGYTGIASNRATAFDVTLSPNPATTWTTVNYNLPGNTTKAVLTLTNMLGVNVLTKELDGTQGNKVIDLRGLATGVYVYTIRYEQFTETGKLVITK